MLWNIESVQLATEVAAPTIHELKIARATDLNGTDVTSLLRNRDGSYYVAMHGDKVTAEFDAPQAQPGMTLTVLARTTGHYYARSSDDRKGHPALVSRLMTVNPFSQGYFIFNTSTRNGEPRANKGGRSFTSGRCRLVLRRPL
jgi:hypothetical protein